MDYVGWSFGECAFLVVFLGGTDGDDFYAHHTCVN